MTQLTDKERSMREAGLIRMAIEMLRAHGWTQGAYARDRRGLSTCYMDSNATCFCALGALSRARNWVEGGWSLTVEPHLHAAIGEVDPDWRGGLASWNDNRAKSKEDVLKVMNIAATRLENAYG